MSALYASITGVSNIVSVSITTSHDSSTSTAIIACKAHTLDVGSAITIDMGYSTSHSVLFTGYVKQISRSIPSDTYSITCADVMTRAIDFFIAPTDPTNVLTYQNITAETLVGNLMALADLTDYTYDPTYFTFGVQDKFEVNLVSPHDYSRRVADLLTWNLWADQTGKIHFENRKPYVMTGTSGQPGDDTPDVPDGNTIIDSMILSIGHTKDTQKLRNKVVVYGNEPIYAMASEPSPYLPEGFYKTTVCSAPGLIDDNGIAQMTADYNLRLLNRLTEIVMIEVIGNISFQARTVTTLNSTKLGLSSDEWYIFSCQQNLSSSGFITSLDLRR